MHFSPVVALLAFVAASSALTTGHNVRAPHHRALAARVAPIAVVDHLKPVHKRANGKRCRPRPSSATAIITSSILNDEPTTTPKSSPTTIIKADPTTLPQNDPTTPTTHKPSPTTHQPDPASTTPKPQPTTTKQAPPATTKAPSSGGNGGLLGFLSGLQSGQATWYSTGLGACGITNNDGQKIAAASHLLFDAFPGYNGVNPNNNPMCGRQVKVSYQGKSVIVSLTDRCEACQRTDLDLSPSAFSELADLGAGRLTGMTWEWV